jgi:hypothetical protein
MSAVEDVQTLSSLVVRTGGGECRHSTWTIRVLRWVSGSCDIGGRDFVNRGGFC